MAQKTLKLHYKEFSNTLYRHDKVFPLDGARFCLAPGLYAKFPARSLALFLPERYSAPGERGIALFSQPCLVPKFAFQTGRNCAR